MNKYKILTLALISFLISMPVFAQNEMTIYLKNGVLLNSLDNTVENTGNSIRNTYCPAIGFNYSRIARNGVIFSGGGDIGYEKYKAVIDYPFEKNLYVRPKDLSPYTQKRIIPFAQLNINAGYRIAHVKKYIPEIRIGQIVNIPLGYKNLYSVPHEKSNVSGFLDYTLEMYGRYGKSTPGFIIEFLNFAYLGCQVPSSIKGIDYFTVGLNFQRQLFFPSVNYYTIRYKNALGEDKGTETFNGRHFNISLQLGVRL